MLRKTTLLCIGLAFSASSILHAQENFMGEIKMFAGNFAPKGWAFCDGQLLPINQYQSLYAILGVNYGGDGKNTFALPDLRGRVPVNEGQGKGQQRYYALGQQDGYETTYILQSNLPQHVLNVPALQVDLKSNTTALSTGNKSVLTTGNTANTTIATNPSGSNVPVNNMQPYLVVHYIICIAGTYPNRD